MKRIESPKMSVDLSSHGAETLVRDIISGRFPPRRLLPEEVEQIEQLSADALEPITYPPTKDSQISERG